MDGHLLLGVKTDRFVVMLSDLNTNGGGRILFPEEWEKEVVLGDSLLMTCVGDMGDVRDFTKWTQANLSFYKYCHDGVQYSLGKETSPSRVHYWMRQQVAKNLRSRNAWMVGMLVGGYSKGDDQFFLGYVDYLGTEYGNQKYLFAGPGGNYCYAIMDNLYRSDMSEEEAYNAIKQCLQTVTKRELAMPRSFTCSIIDKNGHRRLPKRLDLRHR